MSGVRESHFLVLLLSQSNQNLSSGVFDIQKTQYCGAIIRHSDITDVVHHHLVQA